MSDGPAGAPPKKKPLEEAYRELLEALWYASQIFENKGDGGVEGAKLGCRAVARFIGVCHENPVLAAPFLTIMQSFVDLERGLAPPLFAKDTIHRERDRSSHRKHLQMLAAVSLEVLMESGAALDQAARQVARGVQNWPGMDAQKVTATTVRAWRDQGRKPTDARNQQFQQLRNHILGQADPAAEIRNLLKYGPPGVPIS